MRAITIAVFSLVSMGSVFAQGRGDYNHGYGNVVFPGTGGPPRQGGISNVVRPDGLRHHRFVPPPVYPIFYPVPTFLDYGYQQPVQQQQPPVVVVVQQPAQQQATPPVIINQNFVPETAKPVMTEYGPTARQNVEQQQPDTTTGDSSALTDRVVFMIALKDSSVYSAVAYWVEGDTLHYVTPQGRHNQVSLQLVDRAVSTKLNANNKLDLHLPPAK